MSRCFPFPPPGYDRKGRADDPDLIKKEREEKHREKKHKKEKRDKDKKDGKEKRERDRRDEKHKEKEDKKEKHRDKEDKDKNRDRNKNNKILSDKERVAGQPEVYNAEIPKENITDWEKNKDICLDEKSIAGHSTVYNGEELNRNSLLAPETKDVKDVQELPSRLRNEEWRTSNQLQEKHGSTEQRKYEEVVKIRGESSAILGNGTERKKEKEKHVTTEQRAVEGMVKSPGNTAVILVNGTERKRENKANDRKTGIKGEARPSGNTLVHKRLEARPGGNTLVHNRAEARASGNSLVHKAAEMFQTGVEGMAKPVEKNIDRRMDGREKVREKGTDGKKCEKGKDKERDGAGKDDKHQEKEKKKEEKIKEREHKHIEQLNIKDGSKSHIEDSRVVGDANENDHLGSQSIKLQNLPNESDQTAYENIRKRKELGPKGVVHEDDVGPKKMARTLPSSHPSTQNGRSLEPCQASIIFAPDKQRTASNVKPDSKERKLNGIIDAQTVKKPSQAAAHADPIVEASRKPPHPDAKYLSEVLSVPKMGEWSDFDDQGWLFSGNSSQLKDLKVDTSGVDEAPQVWAEALQIESADVVALPYVIPL